MQIQIDEPGYALLAPGQPVAIDLRLIAMMLKINTDLERIGDHAVNIAVTCQYLMREPAVELQIPLKEMARIVEKVLQDALGSFFSEDIQLAQQVLKQDDLVDTYHAKNYDLIKDVMQSNAAYIGMGMNLMMVSHNLERIGDLANNIAEDVIYWKQGREVRHHIEASESQT